MKRRQGFTLVELLVSMALIFFIMAILSQAFVSATSTFRSLKASGDMAEKLRSTTQLLQRDLAADHFEGKKRLSNPTFWLNGPPEQGYFRIWQGSRATVTGPNNFVEGADLVDGINSYRSHDHALAFTIKVRGNQMGDFLSASVPPQVLAASGSFGPPEARYQGNTYNYQWGEVAWFLQPQVNPATGQQDTTVTDPATGSTPVRLFTLYRRQRLAVPDNSLVPSQTVTVPPGSSNQLQWPFREMSYWMYRTPIIPPDPPKQYQYTLHFNNPIDLTVPSRRFGMFLLNPYGLQNPNPEGVPNTTVYPYAGYPSLSQELAALGASNPGLAGSDIQVTDVISFDVRLLAQGITIPGSADPFVTLFTPVNPKLPANITTNPPLFLSYANQDPNIQKNYPGQAYNPAYNMITGPMVFDTWSSVNDSFSNYAQWNVPSTWDTMKNQEVPNPTAIPLWNGTSGPIILAIQVSIRIWDSKTNQTRQVTIVQAM